jgi:mannose-6-phosphate isomerase-like protein (cupin superfamily)
MPKIDINGPGGAMRFEDIVFVYHLKDESQIRWHGRAHEHPEGRFEMHYFVSGAGSFMNGRTRYSVAPGSLFLSKPGTTHQIVATDVKRPITYYAILFRAEKGDGELLSLLEKRIFARADRIGAGTSWRFFFADLREKAMSGNEDLIASAKHQFLAFLYALAGPTRAARNRPTSRRPSPTCRATWNGSSSSRTWRRASSSARSTSCGYSARGCAWPP